MFASVDELVRCDGVDGIEEEELDGVVAGGRFATFLRLGCGVVVPDFLISSRAALEGKIGKLFFLRFFLSQFVHLLYVWLGKRSIQCLATLGWRAK